MRVLASVVVFAVFWRMTHLMWLFDHARYRIVISIGLTSPGLFHLENDPNRHVLRSAMLPTNGSLELVVMFHSYVILIKLKDIFVVLALPG